MLKKIIPIFIVVIILISNNVYAKSWYSGGTLHKANALEWQVASYDNKLATCSDIMCKLWIDNKLNQSISSKIKSVDDLRPFAENLVAKIDVAFKKEPNSKKNKQIYTNQTVASTAAMLVIMMGWGK